MHDHKLFASAETAAMHTGEFVDASHAQCEPIVMTNSYRFDSPHDAELKFSGALAGDVYTRISNPTVRALEKRMAALEHAEEAVAFATGMGAIDAVFSGFLRPGDHLICSRDVFGTTTHLLKTYYAPLGVLVDFADVRAPDTWRALLRPQTRMLFLETPSNPNLYIADLPAYAAMCAGRDTLLVVDNTVATPAIQTPLRLGAHIVVHSAGKYLDGQGRVMGGLVAATQALVQPLRAILRTKGCSISPFNAWVLMKSLETLHVRMRAHSEKAAFIVAGLNYHPAVKQVNYPGGSGYLHGELASRQHARAVGHGGLLSMVVDGDKAFAWEVMKQLKLIALSTNIGDTKSLITHPASTTHGRLTDDARARARIGANLFRLSVGLESADDLLADLRRALDQAVALGRREVPRAEAFGR